MAAIAGPISRMGKMPTAGKLIRAVSAYAKQLERVPAKIDYFATSLPALLLFEANMQAQQKNTAQFFQAQMQFAQGKINASAKLLTKILRADPSYAPASELLAETKQYGFVTGKLKS